MNSRNLRFMTIVFTLTLLLSSAVAAGEIDQGDIPEIDVVCDGVALEYADVDTCWPGDIVSVPVLVTNADTLEYLQIWGVCPTGLTYVEFDSEGTPWSGSIIDTSSGSTIEIHLLRGGTLLPDTSERVIDLKFEVSDSYSFDTSFTIKFGHNIAATIKGNLYDCDVTDTTWGTVTIPNDSVTVTIDSMLAYSYQGADGSDSSKIRNLLKVPVKLYTNFPCSSYVIWLLVPDSLDYSGFDAIEDSVYVEETNTDTLKIYGFPATKPGNDSTHYLCDLRFTVGKFKYRYDDSQTFDTTFYFGFPSSVVDPLPYVYNWGTNDSVPNASIPKVSEGIYLPQYEVSLDIKNASVDNYGMVEVPVACSASFWAQYNTLNIGYDSTLLTYIGIDSTGGNIPPVGSVLPETNSGNYAIRKIAATLADSGLYILPDVEQTLFTLKFEASEDFDHGTTTTVQFFNDQTVENEVRDFFSPDGDKIIRDEDDTSVWSTSNGTVSNPACFSVSVGGPTYYAEEVVRLEIDVEFVNLDSVFEGEFAYPVDTPEPDSVTAGDWTFGEEVWWETLGGCVYLHLPFREEVNDAGKLAYVWITTEDKADFYIAGEESWVEYYTNPGQEPPWDTLEVTVVGDPVEYEWQQPKLTTGLPDVFTLSQNYPNPFNAQTNISFNMGAPGFAELKVFDILGRQVKTLVSEELPAGEHLINWDGVNAAGNPIAGGVYFYVLKAGDFRESQKMLYLK